MSGVKQRMQPVHFGHLCLSVPLCLSLSVSVSPPLSLYVCIHATVYICIACWQPRGSHVEQTLYPLCDRCPRCSVVCAAACRGRDWTRISDPIIRDGTRPGFSCVSLWNGFSLGIWSRSNPFYAPCETQVCP